MIKSLEILDPAKTHIAYLDKIEIFQKPIKFEFTPGLNILWGSNGSGKSTFIKFLAQLFHCEQSGQPIVTRHSVYELFKSGNFQCKDMENFSIIHDGQGVRYFDPSVGVGLVGGMAAFDDDFFSEGVSNAVFKGSSGETCLFRFSSLLKQMKAGIVPQVEWRVKKIGINDDKIKAIEESLKSTLEKGPATVLLDEPEKNLDFPNQLLLWKIIRAKMCKNLQVILASHSWYALNLPEANYIEMKPGYLDACLTQLKMLPNWPKEETIL